MDYSFWVKSLDLAEDIDRLYPISKKYFDSKVISIISRDELSSFIWLEN